MREYKFRGKRIDNGEWVYGHIIVYPGGEAFIFPPYSAWRVDTSTVGQYTGLCDKNDKEIYEGDVLSTNSGTFANTGRGVVREYKGMYVSFYGQDVLGRDCYDVLNEACNTREVIGNIHDNPELLEVTP